jgi:hypothetical protein
MPLQIRRGTEAERQTLASPLVSGELLWITDDEKLYIGNGTTLARDLAPVTGFGNQEARDAAASIFTAGTHSGISFSYDGSAAIDATVSFPALLQNLNTNGFDISGVGNISISGSVTATSFLGDYKGSISADDSTILVDAVNGSINLSGTVKGDVIPDQTDLYDIGSAANRFAAIFLKSDGLHVGSANITSTGSAVNLPAGSTVGGVDIGTAVGQGVVEGSDYNINVVADDSTVLVNSSTQVITAPNGFIGDLTGNVTGNVVGAVTGVVRGLSGSTLEGELVGSVFADNSSLLIDALNGDAFLQDIDCVSITATDGFITNLETTAVNNPSGQLIVDSVDQIRLNSSSKSGFRTSAVITDGTIGNAPQFDLHAIRGTQDSPVTPNVGDYLGSLRFTYYEGVADVGNSVASFTAQIDPAANLGDSSPAGNLVLLVNAGDGLGFSGFGIQPFYFKKEGTFDAPILKTGVYDNDAARDAYITSPEAGMIVFNKRDDSTGVPQFQGYDGTAWVDLH